MSPVATYLLFGAMVCGVTGQIYLPCNIVPVHGCTCLEPSAPIVTCTNLNLTWFPRLPPSASSIHTLNLSNNHLTFLPSGVLAGLKNLRRLDLSHNNLRGVHKHAFQGRETLLEWLDLGYNNLHAIPYMFGGGHTHQYGLWKLRHLGMADNRIHLVEKDVFMNMANLQLLDLDRNMIVEIADGGWDGLTSLRTLRLGFRKMSRHSKGTYLTTVPTQNLAALRELCVTGARPQFMGVLQTWLGKLHHLRHLELVSMKLTDRHLTKYSLLVLSSRLEILSMRDNLLRKVPGRMLASLLKLQRLDLSGNKISKFTDKYNYTQLPAQISVIDLSRNIIRKVKPDAIGRLKNATLVDLRNNNIRFINFRPHSLEALSPHLHLRLAGNPLRCSCPNLGIRTLIDKEIMYQNGHLYRSDIYSSLRCQTPDKYENHLMVHVPSMQFECKRSKSKQKSNRGRKKEQDIEKQLPMRSVATGSLAKRGSLSKHSVIAMGKPITSVFYNRNIHRYLDSEAEVNLPQEIAELLHPHDRIAAS